jgi:hypothetical protein
MSWARGPWARAPFAGSLGTEKPAPAGQQQLPPPIPGGTAKWVYQPHKLLAYGWRSWAGRTSQQSYPGGGISIRPLPESGLMRITAWWPDATVLQLIRVHGDGSLYAVRGASPLMVPAPTRRNFCLNPSFEVGLNGVTADAGSPTLSRPSDGTASSGDFYLKAVNASAGSSGVTVPSSIPQGTDLTIGFDLRLSARATGVTVQINWADATGTPLTASSAILSANDINRSIEQFSRQVVRLATPVNGVTATVKIVAAGMPSAGELSLDAITIERAISDGSYFGGDTYGGTWLGVPGLSASALAPVLTIDDGECPTDVNVRYRVVNPRPSGGSMISDPSTLDSLGATWLTHPSWPTAPRKIQVKSVPKRTRQARQGVFKPLGSRYVLTVSEKARRAPSGTFELYALSWAERDDLVRLFDDMSPVLVRTPSEYGYGSGMWLALGDMDEDPEDHLAYQDARLFSAPFNEVLAPAV